MDMAGKCTDRAGDRVGYVMIYNDAACTIFLIVMHIVALAAV